MFSTFPPEVCQAKAMKHHDHKSNWKPFTFTNTIKKGMNFVLKCSFLWLLGVCATRQASEIQDKVIAVIYHTLSMGTTYNHVTWIQTWIMKGIPYKFYLESRNWPFSQTAHNSFEQMVMVLPLVKFLLGVRYHQAVSEVNSFFCLRHDLMSKQVNGHNWLQAVCCILIFSCDKHFKSNFLIRVPLPLLKKRPLKLFAMVIYRLSRRVRSIDQYIDTSCSCTKNLITLFRILLCSCC